MDQDRLPPQNLEAEQAVLGAILLDNEAIHRALEILRADDFYRADHRRIFRAMVEMSEAQGGQQVIDLITLSAALRQRNELEPVGGASYLASLASNVPTAANVAYHARLIREKAILRELIKKATEIVERGLDGTETADKLLDDAEESIFAISDQSLQQAFVPMSEIVASTFTRIDEMIQHKGVTGVPTGFKDLDSRISGFQAGNLIIVAGRPATGKTAFALNIAAHVAVEQRRRVAIFSIEMSTEELGIRMVCSEARVDSHKLREGHRSHEDADRLGVAGNRLINAPIVIDDSGQMTVNMIRAKARRLKADRGGLDLLIVDYLQLMRGRQDTERREQEVSEISRGLKTLAKELKIPVIAVSQLNRAVEQRDRGRPRLADLRESGALEQDADVVIFLYHNEKYNPETTEKKGITEVIVEKNRNGPTTMVEMHFSARFTRFEDLARP